MRSCSFIAVAGTLALLIGGAVAALRYDRSQRDVIAPGVRIGSVDVGGLNAPTARRRVAAAYRQSLHRPIILRLGSRRFVLAPGRLGLRVDIAGSVQEALDRSRADGFFTRVYRSLTGERLNATIQPQLSYSRAVLQGTLTEVSRQLDRPARDATVAFSGQTLSTVREQPGLSVRQDGLRAAVAGALTQGSPRSIPIPVRRTEPNVTTAELAGRYPTVITVDRSSFSLRLWKGLRLVHRYTIAVGMAGLETPAGLYHVQDKEVDPSWHVPNSSWAGALAGQTIPPGPADPIKARWMGIYNGAGIHGTDELSSLGSAASHGCIRMAIPDVVDLYSQTPLGTPVYIA